jgi:DNA processing protein
MLKGLFSESRESYNSDIIDVLRLIRSENVGPRTFCNLLKIFGNSKTAIENIGELSLKGGLLKPIKLYTKIDVEREIALLEKYKAKLVSYKDPLYSSLLLQIFDYPPILTYKGNIDLLNSNQPIAIVGSRASSINGRNFASKIAKALMNEGFIIVSGLARGIDTAAHLTNPSKTIAVIAGGIDNIYPPENKKLYEAIASEGLLISELKIGTKPLAKHFPQRNRLISGLSLGVCIIEANLGSGSLITAACALEQNRDVFAVPGFPADPRYQGTNKLIKEGAYVIESAQDIISNLNNYKKLQKSFEFEEEKAITSKFGMQVHKALNITNSMRQIVLNLLSTTPVGLEDLMRESNLELAVIQTIILELELACKVTRAPGNKVMLIY